MYPFMDLTFLVYQLMYDGVHKRFPDTTATKKVDDGKGFYAMDGVEIRIFHIFHEIPYVCESIGVFAEKAKAGQTQCRVPAEVQRKGHLEVAECRSLADQGHHDGLRQRVP